METMGESIWVMPEMSPMLLYVGTMVMLVGTTLAMVGYSLWQDIKSAKRVKSPKILDK